MTDATTLNGFKIETDVPPPHSGRGNNRQEALRQLSRAPVGASIHFPLGSLSSHALVHALGVSARIVGGKGWFTARQVDGGARVWKVAEPARAS